MSAMLDGRSGHFKSSKSEWWPISNRL